MWEAGLPDRKVRPKKSHPQWPGKISGRQVSRASPPLSPLEGRGLLPKEALVVPVERYPLPFDGPHWSPWQVLAWIISRDRELVEHMASDGQSLQKKWDAIDWPAKVALGKGNVPATFDAALVGMACAAETGLITASGCRWRDGKSSSRQPIRGRLWASDAIVTDTILKSHPARKVQWVFVWFNSRSVQEAWPPLSSARSKLRPATVKEIENEADAIYSAAEKTGDKPPNVGQIGPMLRKRLRLKGLTARWKDMKEALKSSRNRRWSQGQRQPNHPTS
jgi:hypothetical protein